MIRKASKQKKAAQGSSDEQFESRSSVKQQNTRDLSRDDDGGDTNPTVMEMMGMWDGDDGDDVDDAVLVIVMGDDADADGGR
jgi:hypothetical protein